MPASPRLPQRLRKQHSPRLCHRNDRRSQHHRSPDWRARSEEHTSELQSLMRISYAVFCLKKKKNQKRPYTHHADNTQTKMRKHDIETEKVNQNRNTTKSLHQITYTN